MDNVTSLTNLTNLTNLTPGTVAGLARRASGYTSIYNIDINLYTDIYPKELEHSGGIFKPYFPEYDF